MTKRSKSGWRLAMPRSRYKPTVGDKVWYQGLRSTVLNVSMRSVQIRDGYGFVKTVKKAEVKPWRD